MISIKVYIKNLDKKEVWIITLMWFLEKELIIYQSLFKTIKWMIDHNYTNLNTSITILIIQLILKEEIIMLFKIISKNHFPQK